MTFKVACVQVTAGPDMATNIAEASRWITEACKQGAELICLPENVSMIEPDRSKIVEISMPENEHLALKAFCQLAKEKAVWVLIGSLAIKLTDQKAANRSYLISPQGDITASYDKIHMFDVDLANGESYRESNDFSPGDKAILTKLPWGDLGMTVCYDLRFPHLYQTLAKAGAQFLTVPAAFTRQTGKAHWHVLLRARAIETGCFVFAPAQCGIHQGGRETFGHSLIISPWGEILADGGEDPGIVIATIDPVLVDGARNMVPNLKNHRDFKLKN
ncbi:MAG: carbon-nitrogen hydrolase family protein [Rhodospirillales bacterium]|nr:carbon-nitrogen hydrolase family protein [Rhodospirillales bacterium]